MMNRGLTAPYAVQTLGTLPPHLFQRERLGEFYGTFKQGIRGTYDRYLGWFSGEPSQLDPVSPTVSAERHMALMGGRDSVLAAAETALAQQEYAWAAELLCYPLRVNPKDEKALALKGRAVRKLGYKTENATWRNWYLTCALAYEGAFTKLAETVGANAGFPPFSNSFLGLSNPAMFDALKVKLDGPRSAGVQLLLEAEVAGEGERFWLELRRGVLEVHSEQPANLIDAVTLRADKVQWTKLVTSEQTVAEAVAAGAVCSDCEKAENFLSYFEPFTQFLSMPFYLE